MEHLSFACPFCQEAVSLPDNYCQSCGERLLCVQIKSPATLAQAVADKKVPAPYLVSPRLNGQRPLRWSQGGMPPPYNRRLSDKAPSIEVKKPLMTIGKLLYAEFDDTPTPEDPCEITVALTQAELYASGSYRKPYPSRTDNRALVDMCVQASAVVLAVVSVAWSTESILQAPDRKISQVFSRAEAALMSQHPEEAANILASIQSGTPNVLTRKRISIFNSAMVARARARMHIGLYDAALADLARVRPDSCESALAIQVAQECRNRKNFSGQGQDCIQLSTTYGVSSTAPGGLVKMDTLQALQPEPQAIKATSQTRLASSATVQPAGIPKPALIKEELPAAATGLPKVPPSSKLPPQLLPATAEGPSYWLQESNGAVDSDTVKSEDIPVSAPDIEQKTELDSSKQEDQTQSPSLRDWKTAPLSGKTKFADN